MLDGLLKSAFYTKCKSLIKMIKTRIDVIRRKRNATLKFLKRDIADLLVSGLDSNAFGRAEGLLLEFDVSYCYDFVESSSDFVKQHLSDMDKQRECPANCREAVSSLMSAAAGISDLPELRELRQTFQERYGNSLDYYANKEFVEKLASKSYTVETKIQLLREIASEFLINWDSRAFERKTSMPSAKGGPKTYRIPESADNKYKFGNRLHSDVKGNKHNGPVRGSEATAYKHESAEGKERNLSKKSETNLEPRQKMIGDDYKALNGQKESSLRKEGTGMPCQGKHYGTLDKQKVLNGNDDAAVKSDSRPGCSSTRKIKDFLDVGHKLDHKRENILPANDILYKPDNALQYSELKSRSDYNNDDEQCNAINSMRKLKGGDVNSFKPSHNSLLPPPYVKSDIKVKNRKYGANIGSVPVGSDCNGVLEGISSADSSAANYRVRNSQLEERQFLKSSRENDHGHNKDRHHQDDLIGAPSPKPPSYRRQLNSQSRHGDMDTYEDEVTRKPESKRTYHSRHGLPHDDHTEIDEEESKLDSLLIYYSKKPSSYEPGITKGKSRTCHIGIDVSELQHSRNKVRSDGHLEAAPSPVRSVSLPNDQTTPSEAKEVFNRTASLQTERSSPARHVHPKLPDYDDLAARFAALKGQ